MSLDRLRPLIERVEARLLRGERVILALDGMAAAGKTVAASALAALFDAPVIHMDDFFLPPELRTPERLAEPGGNVHYERFLKDVLPGLRAGAELRYRMFNCERMEYFGEVWIPEAPMRIVEGAYALHPRFGAYADVSAFFAVDPAEQERRVRERDGEAAWAAFRDRWIPLENAYHEAFRTRDRADMVI